MSGISGYHHLTLSTDGAQEDFDFYTKTLGLHSVKRTVLFDGVLPVYHLYYGSPDGDASTLITTWRFSVLSVDVFTCHPSLSCVAACLSPCAETLRILPPPEVQLHKLFV